MPGQNRPQGYTLPAKRRKSKKKVLTSQRNVCLTHKKVNGYHRNTERVSSGIHNDEIEQIVGTFQRKEAVEDFSVAVTYDEIKEKGYSLSAGQYFDIKIDYVDITEKEFNARMTSYKQTLAEQFTESHRLEEKIMKQLDALQFNANVGSNG